MGYKGILLVAALIIGLLFFVSADAEITVDPIGIAISVEDEDPVEVEVTLSNLGDNDVAFTIDFDEPEEEERRRNGPRRDDVDLEGLMFAVFQDNQAWNWFDIDFFGRDPQIDDDQFDSYRNAGAWDDVDFEDYDAIVVAACNQNFFNQYRDNYERFCEYIDGGGAAYYETGDQGRSIPSPGDINNNTGGESDGRLAVSPDPDDENYSLFAEICQESQENDEWWNFGHFLDGNAHAHSGYSLGQFEDDDNIEWFQVIVDGWNNHNVYLGVAYGYGRGCVFTHGGPTGWNWNHWPNPGQWGSIAAELLFYIVEMAGPKWIIADPEEGVIPADDSETFNIVFIPEEMEDGMYEMIVLIELAESVEERDDLEETLIEITAIMSLNSPTADITGTITDAATQEPVEGAMIDMTDFFFSRFSDEEGNYGFDNLPPGRYGLTFTATDYLPTTENVEIEEDDIVLDVALLHSECTPSDSVFFTELNPDFEQSFNFTIENGGNGPLNFTTEKRLLGDANADPWQLRRIHDFEEATGDNMLNGVTYTGDYFVISGGNSGHQQISMIYVFDTEGNPVREFEQFHESRYGMRDLTWDDTLVWGADEGVLYGFTVDGELEEEIEGGADSYRSMTWDPDGQVFWSADITSNNIFATNRNGEVVRTIDRPRDVLIYGLAYWPNDPDGYRLYVFDRGDSTDFSVSKINLDNGEAMLAAELEVEGDSRPGGISITNKYDVYSWVLIGMAQSPDRVGIWQLEARREWFDIDPVEGIIEADSSDNFTMTLNSAGLPVEVTFEGEVVIHHDGVGSETILSVELAVSEGEVRTHRILCLNLGWNMVSVNVRPDEEDIEVLMAGLVEEGLLEMMKDGAGHFFLPALGFNNIPGWFVENGYQVKMRGAADLRIDGISVLRDHPIDLIEGWQLISYYPRFAIEARLALSSIEQYLVIAKDGFGNFYIPAWDFSNMGDMCEGRGYYLNVSENCQLIYTFERLASLGEDGLRYRSVYDQPGRLPVHAVTGENMSLLVMESPPLTPPLLCRGGINGNTPPLRSRGGIKGGVEVGIYTSGKLIGSGVLQEGVCGMAVWGDDPSTDEVDGAVEGDRLEIRLLTGNGLHAADYEVLTGEAVYHTDGLLVIKLTDAAQMPEEFAIISAYPNPFNSRMHVRYSLPDAVLVEMNVYDLSGRHVAELVNSRMTAGFHTAVFDGSMLSSGVYLVRFDAGGHTSQMKVVMVK